MLAEALTVFLALIGTTLSCMNTGARVTYAMGKDDEAPEHFRHPACQVAFPAPRPSGRWQLISAFIGVVATTLVFADGSAPTDATIAALRHGIFSSFGYSSHDAMAAFAQLAAGHHTHIQLRNVHSVCAQLPALHRGLPQAVGLQAWSSTCSFPALACSRTWRAWPLTWLFRSSDMNVEGTLPGFGHLGTVGHLWRHLFPALFKEQGQGGLTELPQLIRGKEGVRLPFYFGMRRSEP